MKSSRLYALTLGLLFLSAQVWGQKVPDDLHSFLRSLGSETSFRARKPGGIEKSGHRCEAPCPGGGSVLCASSSPETCETGECWVMCDLWLYNCPGFRGAFCEIYDEG